MSGTLALQDIHVNGAAGREVKEVTPTRFYALSSSVLVAFGTY